MSLCFLHSGYCKRSCFNLHFFLNNILNFHTQEKSLMAKWLEQASWSGGHEFEPWSGRTWGAYYFCHYWGIILTIQSSTLLPLQGGYVFSGVGLFVCKNMTMIYFLFKVTDWQPYTFTYPVALAGVCALQVLLIPHMNKTHAGKFTLLVLTNTWFELFRYHHTKKKQPLLYSMSSWALRLYHYPFSL